MEVNIEKIQELTSYGHDCLSQGNAISACDSFLQAYEYAQKITDQYIYRACCFNLGACYIASGEPASGLPYMEEAVPPDDQDDGLDNFADLWYNMGVARHATNNIDQAIEAYKKAHSAYKELNNRKLEGECLSKLAVCYHLQDQRDDAVNSYGLAAKVYGSLNDATNQALSLVSETNVLSEMGDIEKCAKVLVILLDICQDVPDKGIQGK